MEPHVLERAAVHAALGEPVRLAIVDELVCSDRAPSELATRFDLPTNLLAHHLGVLERVGLVERTVSSGDRRRRYVRVVPSGLAGLIGVIGVHPDRAIGSALFVCTQNSARSQLAAAIWRRSTGAPAVSAGTQPAARVHPGAVAAARRRGLDLSGTEPRRLADDEVAAADLVITVCDRAHEDVDLPATALHWSVADPVGASDPDPFDRAADSLEHRIHAFTRPHAATAPATAAAPRP